MTTDEIPYHTAGSRNGRAKLCEEIVLELRTRHGQGQLIAELAAEAGVTRSTANKAARRATWRHIP